MIKITLTLNCEKMESFWNGHLWRLLTAIVGHRDCIAFKVEETEVVA